jgi:hypothetical protein
MSFTSLQPLWASSSPARLVEYDMRTLARSLSIFRAATRTPGYQLHCPNYPSLAAAWRGHTFPASPKAAEVTGGTPFRAVLKGGRVGEVLDSGDVARIFKAMAQAAKLTAEEIAGISGHSTRVGAAQDMVRYGVDLVGAMQAGRWKTSAMVARYSALLLAKSGGMAQIADRRVQF